jgi:ComF family protein
VNLLNNWQSITRLRWRTRCLLCGAASSRQGICPGCRTDLPWLTGPGCACCAHPLSLPGLCGRCLTEPPHFDRVIAACRYEYPLDGLIQACKYGGRLTVVSALADIMREPQRPQPDLMVAMPLSTQRLRERGFNQALELARDIARTTGIPLDADLCVKTRDTPPQTRLPWKERRKNIRGAFVVQRNIDGHHIAVIDDVLTTGATLSELARNLKRAGAATVTGWVIARTVAGGGINR